MLAMMQERSAVIKLWDANQNAESSLETGLKEELTFIRWSAAGPQLAIGTAKGNLLLYNKKTLKKQSIAGKHVKTITSGAWHEDTLIMASADRQVTLSNPDGDTISQTTLKAEGSNLQVTGSTEAGREPTVSVVSGGTVIIMFPVGQPASSTELKFGTQYGKIVSYHVLDGNHVAVGFDSGQFVVAAPSGGKTPTEIFSAKLFSNGLASVAISPQIRRAAACNGRQVKVVDLADEPKEMEDEGMSLIEEDGELQYVAWTRDGQVLTVASSSGAVHSFLACLPPLAVANGTKYMYLTSLLELSVCSAIPNASADVSRRVQISMEPTFAALGPTHVAVGMNNHVFFHSITDAECALVGEREYMGTVDQVLLNAEFVAIRSEGRVHLHALGEPSGSATNVFPPPEEEADVTCMAMSKDFLVYGTSRGTITYIYLPDCVPINEYRHEVGVARLFANEVATRLVFVDASGAAFIFNPVVDQPIPIPRFPSSAIRVMWDPADWGVIVVHDPKAFSVYVYSPHQVADGAAVRAVGQTKMQGGLTPIMTYNGTVISQADTGAITKLPLSTHDAIVKVAAKGGAGTETLRRCFHQNLELLRFARAWEVAKLLDERELYLKLGKAALLSLDVELARRAYRQLGDACMVLALNRLENVEDSKLLAGHISLIFEDYSRAQELFLGSMRPVAALEMRRDLLHWEQALKLAKTLAPEQVPAISCEFAQQLEFKGEYDQAFNMYTAGLRAAQAMASRFDARAADAQLMRACAIGVAKMTLRAGDTHEGVQLALQTGDRQCMRDCADILENVLKQSQEAARLYIEADAPEKAVKIYIRTKNYAAAEPLMGRIETPKLHAEYAKAKEGDRAYAEAATAYEKANDTDSVVRLLLHHLDKPQKAFSLVRASKSSQGALLVAKHCMSTGDTRTAIEFFLLAKRSEDAFDVAAKNEQMDAFTASLGSNGTPDEYKKVAQYYEARHDYLKAGEFWALFRDFPKALRFFLQCGERALNPAIEVVGRARSDALTHQLIDFLMGETDGVPKEPVYIFRLYMALGNYSQAAKTAIIIARQEQELGNYRVAHQMLFETYKELSGARIRVPQELAHNLMLLHSYVLVKPLIKMSDHMTAARLLCRVARNISRFPSHIVPILTSCVIECHRAGLRGSAFEYATTLMRPEYREQLQDNFKRKIEGVVRKPGDKMDVEEPETPSPFDPAAKLLESELECPSTRNPIPYCIATGRHVVVTDMCLCPSCGFPASFAVFTQQIESERVCQMCLQEVQVKDIIKMDPEDARAWCVKTVAKAAEKEKK